MSSKIKAAIIDLYNNEDNQGIRCLKDILNETECKLKNIEFEYDLFDLRYKNEIPDLSYDIFISSGGPGSPFEGEGKEWEKKYFLLMDKIISHNNGNNYPKKYVFFICHSFQMMVRYFGFAEVNKRREKSFGIYPTHKTAEGEKDILFESLKNPFVIADFRDWQVVQPNEKIMKDLGAKILTLEKVRSHVDYERAIMSVRLSDEIVGTQFHPEADAASMYYHFRKPERKEYVVSNFGEAKYYEMLGYLEDENGILLTKKTVLPNFLKNAVGKLRPETEAA